LSLLDRCDRLMDRAAEQLRGRSAPDRLFYLLSSFGDHSFLWLLIASVEALSPRTRSRAIRAAIALGCESALVNGPVKAIFDRERPIDRAHPHPYRLRYPRTSSFPSGHATSGFAAACLLAPKGPCRSALLLVAGLVAYSRVHTRVHHASDVIGGACLGLGFAALVERIAPLGTSDPRRLEAPQPASV
jgi:undecaprenyl-diphosphatase